MYNILFMPKKRWEVALGEQIRIAREQRHMKQEELAKAAKTKRGSISSYENGRGNPQFVVIARIAATLETEFNVLGCHISAEQLPRPETSKPAEQLELAYDRDHSFLANVTIRPSKKSITITTHSDYGIKSA